jgi:hypothetical protein
MSESNTSLCPTCAEQSQGQNAHEGSNVGGGCGCGHGH